MDNSVKVTEIYEKPTVAFPMGSYLQVVGREVVMACGRFERIYPGLSPYWHGGPPFVMFSPVRIDFQQA